MVINLKYFNLNIIKILNKMKNSVISGDINYSLSNNDNYLKVFPNKYDACNKLADILYEYIKTIFENSKQKQTKYHNFIMIRGLETIINVYTYLLQNTNNLDLAIYHTHRSFLFYLEFVEQITDEQHVFLQLTSRDATMYVYKKTIFDVKREILKEYISEINAELTYLNNVSQFFKLLGSLLINQMTEKRIDIEKTKIIFNKFKKNNYSLENINEFINSLSKLENTYHLVDEFVKVVDSFSKKKC